MHVYAFVYVVAASKISGRDLNLQLSADLLAYTYETVYKYFSNFSKN